MIFSTARMKQLIAVVIDADADDVTKELLRQGVLHFIGVKEIGDDWVTHVDPVTPKVSQDRVGEVRKRIEAFLSLKGYSPSSADKLEVDRLKPVDLEESNRILDELASKLQGMRDEQKRAQQEIMRLEDISRQLELFGDLSSALRSRSPYSFLSVQTGTAPTRRLETLRNALSAFPAVLMSTGEGRERTPHLLISMKRDDSVIDRILDQNEWVDTEISQEQMGTKEEVLKNLGGKLTGLRKEQEALNGRIGELIDGERPVLDDMWANLRMNELYYRIQSYFSRTARTVVFSGWLPAAKQKTLDEGIKKAAEGRCYLEWNDPGEESAGEKRKVPVLFQNPGILAPFQKLVVNYAVPEYGTVDPTPFVAVAYLAMFGLMFGDAGHGIVLASVGLIGALRYRGKHEERFQLLSLIGWCGLSAVVSGVLFGSYFGMQWFKPLWFDYHGAVTGHAESGGLVRDVYGVLVITIYFGIAVIALGLILNWINLLSGRSWRKLLFDKGGVLGAWIYGVGVYAAMFFVRHDYKQLPPGGLLFWLLGLPALLLALKPPIEFAAEKRKNPAKTFTLFTLVDFGMEWIVELLEIFSGYLANTLSFMRVAGLGIAHVSLMTAFFEIARMIGGTKGFTVWSAAILVTGNLLVIGLEGLSAGIQSLRLNYYEFFSKYFSGTGRSYMPVTLKEQR